MIEAIPRAEAEVSFKKYSGNFRERYRRGYLEETSIVPTIVLNLTSASEDGLNQQKFKAT